MVERIKIFEEFIYCSCNCGFTLPKRGPLDKIRKYILGHKKSRYKDKFGYIRVLKPEHKFTDSRGFVREHRLVYEEHYKCCLLQWADVHHLNGIKDDNRIENLQALMRSKHISLHWTGNKFGKKDMSKRFCIVCGSKTTYIDRHGLQHWSKYKNAFRCYRCYSKNKNKKLRKKTKV